MFEVSLGLYLKLQILSLTYADIFSAELDHLVLAYVRPVHQSTTQSAVGPMLRTKVGIFLCHQYFFASKYNSQKLVSFYAVSILLHQNQAYKSGYSFDAISIFLHQNQTYKSGYLFIKKVERPGRKESVLI